MRDLIEPAKRKNAGRGKYSNQIPAYGWITDLFPGEGIGALCFCGVHMGEMIHWMELGDCFVTWI